MAKRQYYWVCSKQVSGSSVPLLYTQKKYLTCIKGHCKPVRVKLITYEAITGKNRTAPWMG